MKKGENKVPLSQKITALQLLKQNNYNYSKTSKETGFSPTALRNWQKKDGQKVSNDEQVKHLVRSSAASLVKMREDFYRKHYENISSVTEEVIKQIKELVPKEKDLNKLNNVLKTLLDYSKVTDKDGKDTSDADTDSKISLIRQTINQLNAQSGGIQDAEVVE